MVCGFDDNQRGIIEGCEACNAVEEAMFPSRFVNNVTSLYFELVIG